MQRSLGGAGQAARAMRRGSRRSPCCARQHAPRAGPGGAPWPGCVTACGPPCASARARRLSAASAPPAARARARPRRRPRRPPAPPPRLRAACARWARLQPAAGSRLCRGAPQSRARCRGGWTAQRWLLTCDRRSRWHYMRTLLCQSADCKYAERSGEDPGARVGWPPLLRCPATPAGALGARCPGGRAAPLSTGSRSACMVRNACRT